MNACTNRRAANRGERGSAAVEVAVVTPVLIIMLLMATGLGRMAHARQQVTVAARDAARAASLERSPEGSRTAGTDAARRSLGQAGVSCVVLTVSVDLSDYRPGGEVSATVSCTTSMAGLSLLGIGARVFTETAIVPIEAHRSQP